MALVIGLHSPVLGYCAAEGEIFFGEHLIDSGCHHDCQHGLDLAEVPCEEDHDFLTLDLGDFQWSPLLTSEPPVFVFLEDFEWRFRFPVFEKLVFLPSIRLVNPPPPDLPIFRRDAALRL